MCDELIGQCIGQICVGLLCLYCVDICSEACCTCDKNENNRQNVPTGKLRHFCQ